ncbi:transcriptional regulator, LysR family [Methylocella silvestris BL2]|uniref:Transcriptional regulator, LysR family n=1 Tax=Methylocella silvestris (strain DSM 15510 / CIP 108128 / LMG 27833 / NCIMB 13906 / BL2) TaxID=395965 RepID=B8EL96_METSB|nr:LysR family transcriptional regulator [Methylocella silvestris]ACK49091.1 transcriptional regulator, LysR family [Methylocella silvestris BL2]
MSAMAFSDSLLLDPVCLRTFLVIAEGASFSETSRRLGLGQPTVSEHVRKLEKAVGRRLFIRDTHSITMTPEGQAMVAFARSILETNERAKRYFAGAKLRGRLRFGASEDLVLSWLPEILAGFVQNHPLVDLEFTIGLSSTLINRFDAGELDLVLCKRWPGEDRGDLVWRDKLVWISGEKEPPSQTDQAPLILYPPPSLTRFMAIAALERAGASWRIACTSGSLSGLVAAAEAGLGFMAHSRKLIPKGLIERAPREGMPPLGELEFVMLRSRRSAQPAVAELSAAIAVKGEKF